MLGLVLPSGKLIYANALPVAAGRAVFIIILIGEWR